AGRAASRVAASSKVDGSACLRVRPGHWPRRCVWSGSPYRGLQRCINDASSQLLPIGLQSNMNHASLDATMRLTHFTDLSLRLLMYLASNPDRLSTIQEVAERYGISRNHLMKVAQ